VRHFVYVSSASVVYPRLTPYGQAKLDAEVTVAAERRFAYTIVRPTLVYDEAGGQEFMMFRRHLRRFPIVPFIGPGTARKRPVHADDVVDGLARIVGNPRCFGKTYNLSGPEPITLRDLGKLVLELEGAERPFLHLPLPFCRALAAVLARVIKNPPLAPYAVAGFTNDADLDCAEARADFGYAPRGVRAGLTACLTSREPWEGSRTLPRWLQPTPRRRTFAGTPGWAKPSSGHASPPNPSANLAAPVRSETRSTT